MQMLVGGVQRFSIGDGPGIRTTVFIKGCPLACQWCHNPELIQKENQLMHSANLCIGCGLCLQACPQKAISFSEAGFHYQQAQCQSCYACVEACCTEALHTAAKEMTAADIMQIVLRDSGYFQKTEGGLTLSGGECTSQMDFCHQLVDLAKQHQINVAIETAGCAEYDALLALCQKVDHVLYDMKAIDDAVHRKYVGASNRLILENLQKLAAEDEIRPKIQVRMPLIHDVNDGEEIIEATRQFLLAHNLRKVALLPYHEMGTSKSRSLWAEYHTFTTPSDERLREIWKQYNESGIQTEVSGKDFQ